MAAIPPAGLRQETEWAATDKWLLPEKGYVEICTVLWSTPDGVTVTVYSEVQTLQGETIRNARLSEFFDGLVALEKSLRRHYRAYWRALARNPPYPDLPRNLPEGVTMELGAPHAVSLEDTGQYPAHRYPEPFLYLDEDWWLLG
jgi:hypothetical protein